MTTKKHLDNPYSNFLDKCKKLINIIERKRAELIEILIEYETFETAVDEIVRSLETLQGAKSELAEIKKPYKDLIISTFFPLNLPLYSLVLFGIMPSAFSKHVFIRPPEVMVEILKEIVEILEIDKIFPNITYYSVSRNIFVELYAKDSDAIIFTGKYENALAIHKKCPDAALLYNGSGINPFIVFKNANVDLAVEKSIEMRCFNSGQDCAGPDAFFVDKEIADEYVRKLTQKLENIGVGDSSIRTNRISRTIKVSYIDELMHWLENNKEQTITPVKIDKSRQLVYPIVVVRNVDDSENSYHEFFAPVFNVLVFDSIDSLNDKLCQKEFIERGMYVSVFGSNSRVESKLHTVKILKDKIVNDVERGNTEYGGYGEKSNFILVNNKIAIQPVLISRDLHRFLTK